MNKKIISYLVYVSLFFTGCSSKTTKRIPLFSGDIISDITTLLPKGEVTADIMDSINITPRETELEQRFMQAIKKNYDWYVNYQKTIPPDKPMPYDKHFGISKEEYEELDNYSKQHMLLSSGKIKIRISESDNIISLSTDGRLSFLNNLRIDLEDTTITIYNWTLHYTNFSKHTDTPNVFRSKWECYVWTFEAPKNLDLPKIKDFSTVFAKYYTISLGQLEKNKKTVLIIEGTEYEAGKKTVDINTPLIF